MGKKYAFLCAVIAAFGGCYLALAAAVIAGTTRALVELYGLDAASLGLTVSIALWGTIIGAFSPAFRGINMEEDLV
ncbi:MAG: hypothetical protein MZU97_08965 [Bacillus subtilis]|nr:hypothetical protein [Bacillus subtilis]